LDKVVQVVVVQLVHQQELLLVEAVEVYGEMEMDQQEMQEAEDYLEYF
jgi:hypothetical protein